MAALRMLFVSAALLVGAALTAIAVFVVGVRTRNPRVLRLARTIQRDKMNPLALRDAGTAASPWAIVRVPGRVSGRVYDTPVGVERVGDFRFLRTPSTARIVM